MSADFASAAGVAFPHVWITGFVGEHQASFTLPIGTQELMEEALDRAFKAIEQLKARGFSATKPSKAELTDGEDKAIITAAMRRHKEDGGTPIIDFYPDFKPGRNPAEPFGAWRWLSIYLNGPEDIAAFLQVSGFKSLEDIPLYDDDGKARKSAYMRENSQRHNKERAVPTPFYVVRKPNPAWLSPEQIAALKAEGKPVDEEKNKFTVKHLLARYETADGSAASVSANLVGADVASESESALEERNFHAIKIEVVKGKTGKAAYRMATQTGELVFTNSNKQFTDVGYPVPSTIGQVFTFDPPAYIEAVLTPSKEEGKSPSWLLKPGPKMVVKPAPLDDPVSEIPL